MSAKKNSNSDIQEIQKCHVNKDKFNLFKVDKISETIRNLKASRGKEYDQVLQKAREDFSIGINDKWILTHLRLLLVSENVDFKMLHIGKINDFEEQIFERKEDESNEKIENKSKPSYEISEQKSILKSKQFKHTRIKIKRKVRFNMQLYIKFF